MTKPATTTINITFMTTVGVNVGDDFIREGVRAALDACGVSYRAFWINKHDEASVSRPYRDESAALPDKYYDTDVFIQSGAPVYWHLDEGRATSLTSEWHQWLWTQRILGDSPCRPLFINLGAGSCMPWGDDGKSFLENPACADFAQKAGTRAALTTVRDPLASSLLSALNIPHQGMVCPAFLAGARHAPVRPNAGHIGVNLMRRGAHFQTRRDFSEDAWKSSCRDLLKSLRSKAPLTFIAHDQEEAAFMQELAQDGERVVTSEDWRGYLDLYASCALVVANRVHGAVCAAGFGVPAVIMGTDTRASIGDYIGIPRFQSGVAPMSDVAEAACRLFDNRVGEQRRLLKLRDRSLKKMARLIAGALREGGHSQALPKVGFRETLSTVFGAR